MKKLHLIILLQSFFMLGYGQNCFVVSGDATGLENELVTLEEAACSLIDSLPDEFQNDFTVVHEAFYLHTPSMIGDSDEFKIRAIQNATTYSSYYLLIMHQLYPDGHSEYDVELKLPDNWLSNCYDELVISAFTNSVKARFTALQIEYPSPFQRTQIEVEGMAYLAERLGKYTECCLPGSNLKKSTSCTSCITAHDVLNDLDNLGFIPYFLGEITNPDPTIDHFCLCSDIPAINPNDQKKSGSNTVQDYAAQIITIDNVSYDFAAELSEWANQGYEAMITKNTNYCDQTVFQNLQTSFTTSEKAAWIHIWENPLADDEDVVFLKIKDAANIGNIDPGNTEPLQIEADPPPPHEYVIMQRTFAPWDRFGHVPVFPGVHVLRNSFWGDNRGFSLDEPTLGFPGTTSRMHQRMKVKLGEGKQPLDGESKFSSVTRGYENFKRFKPKRIIPHPYKQELDRWEYEPVEEKEDFCQPDGYENSYVQNNITYTSMFFEGADPLIVLPMVAPDIEWYLELGWYYTESSNTLNISGRVIGKEFPAYEAYIEDACGVKLFLYTYSSPCESELASELLLPFPDYNEGFDIAIEVNDAGCFMNAMTTTFDGNTQTTDLSTWNQANLTKKVAQDCPSNPCEGAYPNDNSDKRDFFDCGE